MRVVGVAITLVLAPVALAASTPEPTVLPRPSFPAPAGNASSSGIGLVLVSSRSLDPAELTPPLPAPPAFAPKRFHGAELEFAIRQPPNVFLVYGGRYLWQITERSYAIDFATFLRPPSGDWLEEIRWAREVDGVLYVAHAHLTYASATKRRNAYISAIDLKRKRLIWRSPALVANARTFVVAGDVIVSGYGFTAEPDFLYVLDRRTGRVIERLQVPSAPEIIKLRGTTLHVRTYDRQLMLELRR